jgi:hypothetical protein
MQAPTTHIIPLTTIVRKRFLPTDGRILARVGQKVSPADVIGETIINRKYTIVDVAAILHVPASKADGLLKVKRGQKIAAGDVIGATSGMFGRDALSPVEGRVVAIGSGKIVVELGGVAFELRSGLSGTVTEVIGERGVTIRASGAVIQGIWGNGRMDSGVLLSLLENPDDVLEPSRLDVSLRGSIILGGHVQDIAVLKNAAEMPARGLILSSISPELASTAMQLPFPILLVDGFGRRPMNSAAFKLLSTNLKREISVNAELYDRAEGNRPEIFIPLPVSQEPPEPRDLETFAPGQTVRVCFLAQPAKIGTLAALRPGLSVLPSGLKAPAADVRVETGEQIIVPLSNLEVLG